MGVSNPRPAFRRFADTLLDGEPLDLLIRATLLVFLIGPNLIGIEWQYKLLFQAAAVIGLVAPAVGRSGPFWLGMAGAMLFKTLDHMWMQDNHVFLLTWWCLALALARYSEASDRVVAINARLLIGLSFFFAVVWKGILSPDYMRGDYFHYTFLTDDRFSKLGTLFCEMEASQLQKNYQAVAQLADFRMDVSSVPLQGTPSLRTLAIVVTWWTVFIEGVLAVLFLVPTRWRISRWRDGALLLFAWTTYLAAPVKTFGWTLVTLGLAQCPREARRTRICYLLTYPILLLYEIAPLWATLENFMAGWKK
jgi:hypothetical protein